MIGNAVKILSKYKKIDLSTYKSISIENVRFINTELENLEKTCIQASDVLNCISVGIKTALTDNIPYHNTPALIQIVGLLGFGNILKYLPYAGITMAGVTWGISGSLAKSKAEGEAVCIKIEAQRMSGVLYGLKAIESRVDEGEALLYALSKKLKKALDKFKSLVGKSDELSEDATIELNASIQLIKSIKQVIETDICNAEGFLNRNCGIVFRKIEQEVNYE